MGNWRVFPLVVGLAVVGVGCDENKHDDLIARAAEENAAKVTSALEDATFEKRIQEILDFRKAQFETIGFPVLTSAESCGTESTLRVMYNPYKNILRLTVSKPKVMDEKLRWLSLDGDKVFEETTPFEPEKKLKAKPETELPEVTLSAISKSRPKLFPPGETVTFEVKAQTMVTQDRGEDKFRYVPFVHQGWKVTVPVFSRAMSEAIAQHVEDAKHNEAAMWVLAREVGPTVEKLREVSTEPAKAAVARFEALLAKHQELQKKLAKPPHHELEEAFAIVHDPACD